MEICYLHHREFSSQHPCENPGQQAVTSTNILDPEVGLGRRGIANISAILSMPPPLIERTFSRQMKAVSSSAETVPQDEMQSLLLI